MKLYTKKLFLSMALFIMPVQIVSSLNMEAMYSTESSGETHSSSLFSVSIQINQESQHE